MNTILCKLREVVLDAILSYSKLTGVVRDVDLVEEREDHVRTAVATHFKTVDW